MTMTLKQHSILKNGSIGLRNLANELRSIASEFKGDQNYDICLERIADQLIADADELEKVLTA